MYLANINPNVLDRSMSIEVHYIHVSHINLLQIIMKVLVTPYLTHLGIVLSFPCRSLCV